MKNRKYFGRRLRTIRDSESKSRTKPENSLPRPRRDWQDWREQKGRNAIFWRRQKPTRTKKFNFWRFSRPWDSGSVNTKKERPSRATKEAQPRRGSRLGQLEVQCCSKPGLEPLGLRLCESSKAGSKIPQRWSGSCWTWRFLASGREEF